MSGDNRDVFNGPFEVVGRSPTTERSDLHGRGSSRGRRSYWALARGLPQAVLIQLRSAPWGKNRTDTAGSSEAPEGKEGSEQAHRPSSLGANDSPTSIRNSASLLWLSFLILFFVALLLFASIAMPPHGVHP